MVLEKPGLDGYRAWAMEKLGIDYGKSEEQRFDILMAYLHSVIKDSPFFAGLPRFLSDCDARYEDKTKAALLMQHIGDVTLVKKSYNSVVEKSFRSNILQNDQFPDGPEGGWVKP